jgi:hypothetical protein
MNKVENYKCWKNVFYRKQISGKINILKNKFSFVKDSNRLNWVLYEKKNGKHFLLRPEIAYLKILGLENRRKGGQKLFLTTFANGSPVHLSIKQAG